MRLRKRVAYLSKLVFVEEPRTRCSIPAWEAYSISAFDISESSSRTSVHCIYGPRNITKEMIRILRWKPLPKYLFSLSQTCVLKGKKQLTSFRVQKTRYGRKTFLLLPSGSLDTSEVSSPRRALIPANATNEMRNHQVSSLKESTYPCQRNQWNEKSSSIITQGEHFFFFSFFLSKSPKQYSNDTWTTSLIFLHLYFLVTSYHTYHIISPPSSVSFSRGVN